MVSDGVIHLDEDIFGLEIMNLTNVKLDEIFNGEKTFIKNGKLEITPKRDKEKIKEEIKDKLSKIKTIEEVKQIINDLINL